MEHCDNSVKHCNSIVENCDTTVEHCDNKLEHVTPQWISHVFFAVKRHCDHDNSYKRKDLIGAGLQF